jgi:cytoskeletal protein CcmA (bactofilin family)
VISNLTAGTYQYQFIVTDDKGAVDRDTVIVTVYAFGNLAPVANAGMDIALTLPVNSTTLTGSATDADGTISSYYWSQLSGPSLALIVSPNAASSFISNLVEGAYEYELTVKDNSGATSKDTLRVTVNSVSNVNPKADAGADIVIAQPLNSVTLTGSASDLDGTITGYQWLQVKGPTVALISTPAAAATTVSNLALGIYEFELQVRDNKGALSSDTVQVMVIGVGNQAPLADAGLNQLINLPVNFTTLTGAGTDVDGSIAGFAWRKISGPASGTIGFPGAASTAVTNLGEGTYIFELTVTDNKGASGKDSVVVTVSPALNLPPVVNAGADQAIMLPQNSITLTGSASDADGSVSLISWTQLSGPAGSVISQPAKLITTVTGLSMGIYEFELSVTDNAGATTSDIIQVTVNSAGNQAPVADAGADQDVTLPVNVVTLSGTATDIDGTISTYAWTKISGPAQGLMMSPNSATTLVTNLAIGVYSFELTVTDNNGANSTDTIKVTVLAAVNQAPLADAGKDQTISLPVTSATLAGMGTDDDGTIASYNWTKISGPAAGAMTSPNAALTLLNNLAEGTYTYVLTVTDDDGAVGKDTVIVTVTPAPNQFPSADAGANIVITLPLDSTLLNGSAADVDGTIVSYSWKMISGAAGAGIKNATQAAALAYSLKQGQYLFELTVQDNDGAASTDTVQVTVNPAINLAPVANAGSDVVISLPVNSTLLNGSATDADGTIVSVSWTKISGPAAGNLTGQNTFTTSAIDLVQGSYGFELTVTDNNGAVSKDVVNVIVNAVANLAPVANAGIDQQIQLPVNSTTLNGTGTDADGNIASYTWAKISGPASGVITSPTASATALTNLVEGIYQYQLIVRDNNGATARDTIQVTVNAAPNQAPVANAGMDQTIALPKTDVTLTGDATDVDGAITSYSWRKISGPAQGTIASPGSGITSVINLVVGVYQFEFSVTDDKGATARDTVQVTVTLAGNELPTANAGVDQDIILPVNTTTLTGNASDPDGFITTYLWRKISGPASGTIATPSSATSAVNSLVKGIYLFEFTVTDNDGAVVKDTIRVSVNDVNFAPVANAGANQTITLPANSVTLNGTATDSDGTITRYAWVKISGPAAGSLTSPGAASTNVSSMVQGLYEFELTVTDDDGATGKDTIQVTVNDSANKAPVANAGLNKTVTLPVNSTTLSGSGTDADGTIVRYSWVKISGPAAGNIVSPGAAVTTINSLAYGTYKFELTVTDNDGAIAKDIVEVSVISLTNLPPVANAGQDQVIIWPRNSTTLHGTGTDPDGTVVRYTWSKVSGPQGTLTSPNSADPTLKNLVQGVYVFELTVRDNDGSTSVDLVQITVTTSTNTASNIAPTANAGADKTINLPVNTTTLNGSGTDSDGTISSYAWTKLSGPAAGTILSPASGTSSVTGLVEGVYEFVLTVKDNVGATGKDTIRVNVTAAPNQSPVADAGMDQSIDLPVNFTTLYGIGIDPDGTISSYGWKIISGPATGNIFAQNSATTAAGNLVEGVYAFELTVTDNNGASARDTLVLTVNPPSNQPPVADAGSARVISLPTDSVTLNGKGTDADGQVVSYGWIQVSGPSTGTIAAGNTPVVTITNLVEGIYQFELTVTDNDGAIARDIVEVTVSPAANQLPVANAGTDKIINLPVDSTTLDGSGADADGNIAGYKWTRISGPAAGIIAAPNDPASMLTNLVEGVYEYQLTVTDNNGDASKDTMKVTVLGAPNQAPIADAGSNRIITLPVNTTTLTGAGTDADGTVVGYAWVKTSGPATGNIASPNSGTTALNNLVEGVYIFQLTVTDDEGAVSTDEVTVTVNAASNQAPVANAGSDKFISLPISTISLLGTGDDADGTITSFAWTKVSGPASGTIASPNTATTSINKLVEGIYLFELTVTDNEGAISTDVVQVSVYAGGNLAPGANAGSDRIISLPVDTVSVHGSGTDADGSVTAYQWSKLSGPASGYITWPDSDITTIIDLTEGVYLFQLAVTDNNGATTKDTIKITVLAAPNQAPVADAGLDKIISLPTNSTTLAGTGTEVDGTIAAYKWVQLSGPVGGGTIALPNAGVTAVNGLVEGVYTYQLMVTDNKGATSTDTVIVTVTRANIAPVAKAGSDLAITLPVNSVTLTGSGTDADGAVTGYSWLKLSGPSAGSIASINAPSTVVTGLVEGIYYYQLTIVDNSGGVAHDTIVVTVNAGVNQPPLADAGMDLVIDLPTNSTTLQGSGVDADGVVVTYSWSKIAGPAASLASPGMAVTAVNNLAEGIYQFELVVTDNDGAVAKDTITVKVNALPNTPPVSNAGIDQVLTLPVNSTSLSGVGADADGTVSAYQWTKVTGPAAGTIVSAGSANTLIEGLVEGVYQFELTVTDNRGGTASDTLKITVDSAFNHLPVAVAGADQVITLPANTATLTGSGTDTDGRIVSYAWIKISGPASGTIASPFAPTTAITQLVEGTYIYKLTVTDNMGAIGRDTIRIAVEPLANLAPVAIAGPDIDILLPVNKVSLTGAGKDSGGVVVAYSWKVLNGPAGYNFIQPDSAKTVIENLFQGVYEVEFTVTDDRGATGKDTMKITVSSPRLAAYTDEVKLYPNPLTTTGKIDITTSEPDSKVSIAVTNTLGMQVKYSELFMNGNTLSYQLDLSNLGNAYYFVTVRYGTDKKKTFKVLKTN